MHLRWINRIRAGNRTGLELLSACALLGVLAVFFISTHYVMAYSDPNHWLLRAVRLGEGDPMLRRVLLFPAYILVSLKILGPDWVFLANLPFLLLLAVIAGKLTGDALTTDQPAHSLTPWIAAIGTLVAAAMLTLPFNGAGGTDRVIRLLNPYRDAGATAMVMTGLWFYLKSELNAKTSTAFVSGLMFGCSMSFRETTPLTVVGVMALFCIKWASEWKTLPRNRWAVSLIMGGVLGITPLLIQNYLYSGYAFIPAYSARLIVQEEGRTKEDAHDPDKKPKRKEERLDVENAEIQLKADNLIPAMDPAYFVRNIPTAVKLLDRNLGTLGLILFGAGVAMAVKRRNRVVLGVLLPGWLATFLFFACYSSVKWRYMFGVMALSFPIIGYGTAALIQCGVEACRRFGRKENLCDRIPKVSFGLIWVLWVFFLISYAVRQPHQMKVWDVASFREDLAPHLETPRTFLGFYHHREMLSWMMDHDFNRTGMGTELNEGILLDQGLEAALKDMSSYFRTEAQKTTYYSHETRHLPTLSFLWLDAARVVSLETLETKATRYGKELDGWIYHLKPWGQTSFETNLSVQASAESPQVLLINVFRIWDDPDRTFARASLNGVPLIDRLENGPQLVEVPAELAGQELRLEVESDAPLPSSPIVNTWSMNEEWVMPMGFQRDTWYHSYWSANLVHLSPLREGVSYLWDEGEIRLPTFAASSRKLFAELHLGFFQEDPQYRNLPHWVEVNGRRYALPPRRENARIVVPLGKGKDALEETLLRFKTSLPSFQDQRRQLIEETLSKWACVQLYSIRVFSLDGEAKDTFSVEMGDATAGAFLVEGVHKSENHLGTYPVRWTTGACQMRIPLASSEKERVVRIRYFAPPFITEPPELMVKGDSLELLEHTTGSDKMHEVTYQLSSDHSTDESEWLQMSVRSKPWSPAEQFDSNDSRTLGIMLHRVDIE